MENVTYDIKGDTDFLASWRKVNNSNTKISDWTTAGLQYWLNTKEDESEIKNKGYLSYLSEDSINMIEETIYYLGNVSNYLKEGTEYIDDNANQSFQEERGTSISAGNKEKWMGKVGLMYPSDYGFSLNNTYWNNKMDFTTSDGWMYDFGYNWVWLISPSTTKGRVLSFMDDKGIVSGRDATDSYNSVMPTLYLKSNVKITGGDGSSLKPYSLTLE